ncbi:MAG: FG-GAP-like repeat-containing protein, partial [Planctomycetaceae bacterium]
MQGRKYFSVLPEGTWAEEYEFLEVSGETPRLLESGDASGVAFGRIPGLTGSTQDSRLVVADAGSSSVRLYRGAGYGLPQGLLNQQVTAEYAVTGPPADLLLHDLDGNGTLDLATANSSASGAVSILLGSGGVFNPAAGINLPAGSSALTVGDVNQDGFPDLLVAGTDGVVRLLRGNGNGSFQSPVDTVQSASISGLYVADMNGDGRVDLFVESQSAGRVTVFQGNGNGSFTARGDIQPAGGVRSSRLADVNRDGLTDLVIGTSTGKINLYLGKEVSVIDHMDLQWVLIELPSGDAVRDLQVADLTGDDRPEITVLQTVLKAGHFSSLLVVCSPPAVADGTWNVRSEERGDFQYLFIDELGVDGRPDLLMADRSGGNFFWYLNDNLPYETSQQAPYNANRFPTLDVIAPVRMPEDAAAISVPLTGISAGGFENQKLRVTAVSSQTTLLDNPQVVYTDFSTTGQLRLQPVPLATGVVQVTVTVDDAGFDNDFNTLVDNRSFSRSFEVTIVPQRPVVTVPAAPVKAPFTVTWTAVPDAVSYRVFVRNYSLGQNPIVTAETTQTSWTSAADLAMGRCEVWVQAVAAGGKRLPWSLGRRFTVATPPVTAAVPARLADPSHEFSWTAVPGASEYRVWVTFVSGGANPLVQQKVTGLKW